MGDWLHSPSAKYDLLIGILCAAFLLALLWISVPEHDLLRAFWSSTMAAWLQAIGAVAAVSTAVMIARTEVKRVVAAENAVRHDLLTMLCDVVVISKEDCQRLESEIALREGFGLPIDEQIADFKRRALRITSTIERVVRGRTLEVGLLLVIADLIDVLSFEFLGRSGTSHVLADMEVKRIHHRLDDIQAKMSATE